MLSEMLADSSTLIFRPAIVLGDSAKAETTQFDMVQALCALADLPVLPMSGNARLDIVNADFVGPAIARLHLKEAPKHKIYHLSSGTSSPTAGAGSCDAGDACGSQGPALYSGFLGWF